MNARPFFSVSRLATGISRISIRRGHTKPPPPPRNKSKGDDRAAFDPGHGEQIWIFNHMQRNHVVYSHQPILSNNKAMRQIPFNGKKLKPVSLRKDYWRPMAMVQFPSGLGVVGRSVFQKLREFRKLHELAWDNDEYLKLSKHDRGVALNDQKANTVADVATVLGGAGKGNKIWEVEPTAGQERREGEGEESKQAHGTQGKLHSATVFWANAQDQGYAASWPSNVTHQVGLPPQTRGSAPEAPQEEGVDEPVSPGTEPVVA